MTKIGNFAFFSCSGFSGSLLIPNSVTFIGNSSFSGCTGFNGSLFISNSLTKIGEFAFYGCSGLTGSLLIPFSVSVIERFAFFGCSGFIDSLVSSEFVEFNGESSFSNCSGFTSLLIFSSHLRIDDFAFYSTNFVVIKYEKTTPPKCGSKVFPSEQNFLLPFRYKSSEFCGLNTKSDKIVIRNSYYSMKKFESAVFFAFSIFLAVAVFVFLKKKMGNLNEKNRSSYILFNDIEL